MIISMAPVESSYIVLSSSSFDCYSLGLIEVKTMSLKEYRGDDLMILVQFYGTEWWDTYLVPLQCNQNDYIQMTKQ